MSFEEQVRERAYHIWLADGMADGHAHEHWVYAEQALRGATASAEPVVIITKAAPKAAKAAAAKPAAKVKDAKASKPVAAKKVVAKPAAKLTAKPKAAKSSVVHATTH